MCGSHVGYRQPSTQPTPYVAWSDGRGFASDVARCGGGVWLGFQYVEIEHNYDYYQDIARIIAIAAKGLVA
jgi:hypothetical protein